MQIKHNQPTLGRAEYKAARTSIMSGLLINGVETEKFETALAEYFQIKSGGVVCLSSGSAAIFLALALLQDVSKVHIPVFTCSAVSQAVRLSGKQLSFIDNVQDTPNAYYSSSLMQKNDISIIVDTFGQVAEIDTRLLSSNSIEDISQAFGAVYAKAKIGMRTKIAVGSLSATKIITSGGQGGFLILEDDAMYLAAKDFLNYDGRSDTRFRFNLRMTEAQAAIGRVQLTRVEEFLSKREAIFQRYISEGIPLIDSLNVGDVRYRAILRHSNPQEIISRLSRGRIDSIVPFKVEEFQDDPMKHPHAKEFADSVVSLPIYPNLSLKKVSQICAQLREII